MQLDLILPSSASISKEVGLSVAAVVAATLAIRYLTRKAVDPSIRGPKPTSFFFGNALETMGSLPKWHTTVPYPEPFLSWIKEYGGAVYYREFLADVVLLSDPRALQHVLATNGSNYPRDAKARKYATTLFPADNLSTTEGVEHDKLRKMFNPYFGLSQIKEFLPLFEQCTRERLLPILEKAAKSKEIVNMKAELTNFTLAVIGQVSFNCLPPPSVSTILGMTYIPGDESLPFREPSRRRAAKKALFGAIEDLVQHKLASKNAPNDMMDLFLPKSTRLQAISYAIQMTAAGHETSSSTLAFVVAESFHGSDVVAAMRAECNQVLEKHGTFASWEATEELSYTTAVVQETLCLRTVVQILHRRVAVKDDRIPMSDGSTIVIPKGTAIEMFTSAMHRNPRYWTKPDDFIPERFLPGTPEWSSRTSS
ncbi:hypothetical protein AC1031_010133 [Aphanomyces cochlioides]|nr:hypothetical protein AC1031_010133 [Aphanomyces cochlioides]